MIETQEMIDQNNQLRKQLNKANREYYEKLLSYMRVSTLLNDEIEVEEILLQILQDMITAQEDGVSAENYFGKNPKEIADEMKKQLNISLKEIIKIVGIIFGISVGGTALPGLITPAQGINVLNLFVQFLLSILAVILIFIVIKRGIYSTENMSHKRANIFFGIGIVSFFAVVILSNIFMPEVWMVNSTALVSLFILILGAIFYTIYAWQMPKESNQLWKAALPLAWIFPILGLLYHLDATASFMESEYGIWLSLILVFASLIYAQISMNKDLRTKE